MTNRLEQDSLGQVEVPQDAYFGTQTQRAIQNFPISGLRLPFDFLRSLALIKKFAAVVNVDLELLPEKPAQAIIQAAQEIRDGNLQDQFEIDVFQTGSGTSTNMNMNEVIAGRANEILTGKRGGKTPVHPNDHVNLGQSSNDLIPSALHMAAYTEISSRLIPSLETLLISLKNKSEEFSPVVKIGRTHLQDALPVTLGQEFSGYAQQVQDNIQRFSGPLSSLSCLALGGTAIGTGVNTHPDFAGRVIQMISQETGYNFREAENHFSAQAAQDAAVETSGVLKTLAVSLFKIANDIRWLASGPRCGLGEINLPALQPGSSIMPGKVNPVIPEAVIQAAAQVMGNDTAITLGGQGGTFELNTMLPLIAYNLLQSIRILGCAAEVFAGRCVEGITANQELCASRVEQSLAMATFIVPVLGYDRAAMIADEAHETGKTILEVLQEKKILSEEELQKVFGRIF